MKILFVDDMAERHDSFKKQLLFLNELTTDYEVWYAWDGEQGQKLIAEEDFDVMFLDHDLGDDQYTEHRNGVRIESKSLSGTDLAIQVAALSFERQPKTVIIHSWNRYGAARMSETIINGTTGSKVIQCMFSDDLIDRVCGFLPIKKEE